MRVSGKLRSTLGVRVAAALGAVALAVAACSGDDDSARAPASGAAEGAGAGDATAGSRTVDPYHGYASAVYGGTNHWICHPDLADDACRDLSATEILPDGSRRPADLRRATDPPIDCFYVYPTVSTDKGVNSDLTPNATEISTVGAQAAPFASTCRVFAPAYRQITLAGLGSGAFNDARARATAYGDVLDAWKTYISHDNHGRGVLLIGHSQGSGLLIELMRAEIDRSAALRSRLVSAIILGGTVAVPEGKVVGGVFAHIPGCQSANEVGCVLSFSSYPAATPPRAGAFFARAPGAGRRALCVDPVALAGGDRRAEPIIPTSAMLIGAVHIGAARGLDTRYVVLPDALQAGCRESGNYDYFGVAVASDQDKRPLDGLVTESLGPAWGLHLYDANLAMGNLLEVVARQARAFTKSG